MRLSLGSHLPGEPIEGWKLAAVFVPFLFPLLITLGGLLPIDANGLIMLGAIYLLAGLWVASVGAGLVKGFPTWALPALGVALYFASFYLLKWPATGLVYALNSLLGRGWAGSIPAQVARALGGDPVLLVGGGWPDSIPARVMLMLGRELVFLIPMLLVVSLLVFVVSIFRQRVRQDWSLLSFFLYGLALPPVMMNDPYRGLEPFELAGVLLLSVGAWLFLIVPGRWQRLLVLLLPALLVPVVLSIGIYLIFPAQEFAAPNASFRLWEALQPVLEQPASIILLCTPALLSLFPPAARREVVLE